MGNPMSEPGENTKEFVRLFTRYSRRVYSFIRTLVHNQADAEELFQETSATLWEKFDTFRPGSDFRAWAFQVAHYKVLNYRQRRSSSPLIFSDGLVESIADDTLAMSNTLDARFRALADCYEKLSQRDRELIDLRYTEGATVKGVAAQLSRSVDFVYKALRRIHGALYRCISRAMNTEEPA